MSLLDKYLQKIGVQSYTDLNDEERATFRTWENALSGRRLTDEDVQNFLDSEYTSSVKKLATTKLSERDDTFLKMKVEFIIKIKEFLASPVIEKKMVEQQISAQLNNQ